MSSYQWERTSGTSFGTITGATGSTYTVANADSGLFLRVHETVSNVYSAARGPVGGTLAPFFSYRGLVDINRASITDGWYAVSNFNSISAYQNNSGNTAQLVKVLDRFSSPVIPVGSTGHVWMGGFRSSRAGGTTPAGGIMRIEDPNNGNGGYAGKLEDVLTCTDNGTRTMPCQHPTNSHRYNLLDDTQIGAKSSLGTSWALYVSTVGTFVRRIHSVYGTYNPTVTPLCSITTFRGSEVADWVGVADELWLDLYPNKNAANGGYNPTLVPSIAGTCDRAGIQYVGMPSAHDYSNTQYPTPGTFTRQMDEWRATNAAGVVVYQFPDDGFTGDSLGNLVSGGTFLAGDTTSGLREQIAIEMLKATS